MRARTQNLSLAVLALLLAACLAAVWITRDQTQRQLAAKRPVSGESGGLVDARLLQTAEQLDAIADTAEEQGFSREALRLSDHEVDQAFASLLREAAQAGGGPASGPAKQLNDRINRLNAQMAADQARITKLTPQASSSDGAAQLELAKAQLALDQDDLEDARQDLARAGGDQQQTIARAIQEHEDRQHHATAQPRAAPLARTDTLSQQIRVWISLGDRERQLELARSQAAGKSATLLKEHSALESLAASKPATGSTAAPGAAANQASSSDNADEEDTAQMVARLRRLADQRKALADLDKRIQDTQQLTNVYAQWKSAVGVRRTGVVHLMLRSLATVLAILLAMVLINRGIRHAFRRQAEHRRLHQLRVMSTIAVQVVAVLLILLVALGPPNQISTVIGLATAGLTVALKDFILAFFGWFALMGRNGIRIGDWVEIGGVGGEVIEIGLLKTVLLEMGNWSSTGHPTGRRVSFVNSFAIEGHYFNFSTAGQWLWDELQVTLPSAGDPYQLAQQIRQAVEHITEADSQEAEKDWERVTSQYGMRPFSAKPAVDLRPSVAGLEVVVRYITRAPRRYEVKSHLFQAIVELLHGTPAAIAEPTRSAGSPA